MGGGSDVYIHSDEHSWVPARVVEKNETTAKVAIPQYDSEELIICDGGKSATGFKSATVQLKDYAHNILPLQNVGPDGGLLEVNDMVNLPYLHEAAILFNLKSRHMAALPYSRVADIVIAVNPYQWLTHLYLEETQMLYAKKIVWDVSDQDPRIDLDPHIYEVSSLCYKGLAFDKQDQSILVSGESGAGKSETVKICMNHIATVQQDPDEKMEGMSPCVKRILDSNPLLEAFGNAKTRRNDNSSRFGKYIMLQFDHTVSNGRPRAILAGSTCDVYLLEKSRVVDHEKGIERTYHIFYQLIKAPDEMKTEIWSGLSKTTCESFAYIGTPPEVKIDGKEDGQHFIETKAALELVGIEGESYLTLYRAVATVLQLGQLTFAPKPSNDEETDITSKKEFQELVDLVGCDEKVLSLAFTERTIKTRGESFKVPLKADVAKESADAFSKEIYAKLFLWLVRSINDATCAENNYAVDNQQIDYGLIGLLDIFGFESFPINGFEQLCINYCNEKLQQKFTQDIFRTVQEEYSAEGLDLAEIKYDDNSDILELIEGKLGFIKQLNEECVRPKGNDQAFVSKALQSNKNVPCLIAKISFSRNEFGIHHFAGPVVYRALNFVVRNTDTLPVDMKEAAKLCKNDIISKHLENNKSSNQTKKGESSASTAGRAPPRRAKSNLTADTVMTQFKTQLGTLMKGLKATSSRYIRCVKPNTLKKKLVVQHFTTLEQLRCAGVIAAVTISRSAYPSKLDYSEVIHRYSMLNTKKLKDGYPTETAEIDDLMTNVLVSFAKTKKDGSVSKAFAVGKTKIFFKSGCLEYLESEKGKIWYKLAVTVQAPARGFLTRKRLERERIERERIAAELAKKAEEERIAAEIARKAEEERIYNEKHAVEIAKKAEEERILNEKKAEEERILNEKKAEEERIYNEKHAAEIAKKAEEERILNEKNAAEIARKAEQERILNEKKAEEERILNEKKAEEEREKERMLKEKKAEEERAAKKKFAASIKAVIILQCFFRMKLARKKTKDKKKMLKIEKRLGKKWKKAATKIQAIARGYIQRPKYKLSLIRKKEEEDLSNQLDKMKDQLVDAEDKRKRDLEEAKFTLEQEMEEYKEKLEDQLRSESKNQGDSAQHQTLIDESGKIIEYLRKENMKLRKQSESMKRDYKSLKDNNARLTEANASASTSFNQLNEHAKGLNGTNSHLIRNVDAYKKQLVKMKEDLKNRQAFYVAEAHARVAYQKTLARIVAQVQDRSRDAQLVEDVVIGALECEAEAKAERAALENSGKKAPPGGATSGLTKRVSQKPDSDDESDSDSD